MRTTPKKNSKPKSTATQPNLDSSSLKGKNTRGTKGEQMRVDPEAHGLVLHGKKPKRTD